MEFVKTVEAECKYLISCTDSKNWKKKKKIMQQNIFKREEITL